VNHPHRLLLIVTSQLNSICYLLGGLEQFYFSICWEESSQLTFILFRGIETINQIWLHPVVCQWGFSQQIPVLLVAFLIPRHISIKFHVSNGVPIYPIEYPNIKEIDSRHGFFTIGAKYASIYIYIILYYFIKLCYINLYYSILYYTILFYIILYYHLLFYIILYYHLLFYIIFYLIFLLYIIYILLYSLLLYYIILFYLIYLYLSVYLSIYLSPAKSAMVNRKIIPKWRT